MRNISVFMRNIRMITIPMLRCMRNILRTILRSKLLILNICYDVTHTLPLKGEIIFSINIYTKKRENMKITIGGVTYA